MSLCWKIYITPNVYAKKEGVTFILAVVLLLPPPCRGNTVYFPNMVRGVKFSSHAWGIRPITMHLIASQSEHTSLFRTMSFVKIYVFQKGRAERSNNNVLYVEIMCFLNLKPRKHIALHQIHKIMLFLASSYDPLRVMLTLSPPNTEFSVIHETTLQHRFFRVSVFSLLYARGRYYASPEWV